MRIIKEIEINGRQIVINELTVEEVTTLLDSLGGSLLGMMFDGRLPVPVVVKATGVTEAELKGWYPSDVEKLLSEVEAVNPHSAQLCANMVKFKAGLDAILKKVPQTSAKPAVG